MSYLVVDVGTSAVRVHLYDAEGSRVRSERESLPADDIALVDARAVGEVAETLIDRLLHSASAEPVESIAVSAMLSFLLLDDEGNPLTAAHTWADTRGSTEIEEFTSGKDRHYVTEGAKISTALTPEQRRILEERGELNPTEIHRLASKTQRTLAGSAKSKPVCHSDYVADDAEAKRVQEEALGA